MLKQTPKRASIGDWIEGARIRTLGLAVAPVAIGVGAAAVSVLRNPDHTPLERVLSALDTLGWDIALLALGLALALQIGVNFANDYSDGIRGTDDLRVGPQRLTGSGKAKPKTVLAVALGFFALAAIFGTVLVFRSEEYWLFGVGAAAVLAAWFYTGGKRPYGYFALGEVMVFVFFGLVATWGTTYLYLRDVNQEAILGGIAIGCIAVAVLLVNNLRDIDQDRAAGKRTLSVFVGKTATKVLYVFFLILVPYALLWIFEIAYPATVLVYLTLLLAVPAAIITIWAKTPKELILALKLTGLTGLSYGLLLGFGLFF